MGRRPCCSKEEGHVHRGAWTEEEDGILTQYVAVHGEGRWRTVPKKAGLKRCGKSCRLRWLNYLRPDIKRGNISDAEEELIIRMHKLLGNRWSLIAGRLPGRTDNEIKNYWNTNLSKKLINSSSQTTTTTAPNKPTKQRKPRSDHRITKITKPSYKTTKKIRPTKSSKHSKSDQENKKSGNTKIESQIPAPPITSVLVQLPEIHELGDAFLNMEIGSSCLLTDFVDQEMVCGSINIDHEYCYGDHEEEGGGTKLEDKIMNNANYGGNSDADQQLYGLFQHTLLEEMMMEDNISHEQQEDITPDIKSLLSLMDLQQDDGSWS